VKCEVTIVDNKEIGLRIMSAREAANLTKKDLASKVHVADSTIMRYEKGQINKIKMPIIEAIANALDVNPLWLLGKSNVQSINSFLNTISQNNLCLSENEKDLIKKYRRLDDVGKATVDAVIDVQLKRLHE
jgi:transcriptional regulator with XRE-family HTH domain